MVPVIDSQLALGFGIGVAAAACYDTGYALQALEARRAPPALGLKPSLFGHLLKRRLWVFATVLSLIGWPLQILALTKAPLTLVQPTLALGLILLLVLGAKVLHERIGPREIAGTLIVIGSVGLSAWAAPGETGEVPRDAGLLIALSVLAAAALAPYLASLLRRGRPQPVVLLIAAAGAADGLAAFVAKLIAEDASAGAWAAAAAWVALVGAVIGLGFLAETTALQRAPATRVAPSVLVMQIAIPIALAPLVGGESWSGTPLGGGVLVIALAGLVTGVALLASGLAVAGVIAETPESPGKPLGVPGPSGSAGAARQPEHG
jgi:drug/metabolite transporter (DMT)-like permease